MYKCVACREEFKGHKYNANKYCSYRCYHETRWPKKDRKYTKLDGVWYRTECSKCGKLLQGYSKRCWSCYYKEIHKPVIIAGESIDHYHSAHRWIKKQCGMPNQCEQCGVVHKNSRRFNWANMSGKYLKELSDWKRLCVSCHVKLDRKGVKV